MHRERSLIRDVELRAALAVAMPRSRSHTRLAHLAAAVTTTTTTTTTNTQCVSDLGTTSSVAVLSDFLWSLSAKSSGHTVGAFLSLAANGVKAGSTPGDKHGRQPRGRTHGLSPKTPELD